MNAKLQSLVLRAEILKMELSYAHRHYGSSTVRLLTNQLRLVAAEMEKLSTVPARVRECD